MQRDIAANGSKTYRRYASAHLIFIDVEQRVRSVPRAPARGTATSHAAYGIRHAACGTLPHCVCVCVASAMRAWRTRLVPVPVPVPIPIPVPVPAPAITITSPTKCPPNAHTGNGKRNPTKKIFSQNDCDTIATTSAYSLKLEN